MNSIDALWSLDKAYTKLFNRAIGHPQDAKMRWAETEIIYKALVTLKMIKEKLVDVEWLDYCIKHESDGLGGLEEYNKRCSETNASPLNEADYSFLKEWMEEE